MADKYAVAAGGNWSAAGTWSLTDGGAGGAGAPSASENAYFSNQSGNVVVDTTVTCLDLDFTKGTGYAGTLSGSSTISISGSVTFRNVAHTFAGTFNLVATSGTKVITSNGKVWSGVGPNFTINGVGGTFQLADAFSIGGNTFTLSGGTLDLNGQTIACGNFTPGSATATRAITWNAGTINCSNWNCSITTGLTLTMGASGVINSGGSLFTGGGQTYAGSVNITVTTVTIAITGANSFGNLTLTSSTTRAAGFTLGANQSVTGSFRYNGISVVNRCFISSDTVGTPRTITAAAIHASSDFTDFQDITAAGAAAPFATGTSLGDALGNSGITFTPSVTQTATGTASFTWSTHGWTTRVPLPQDDVVIPNAFVATRIVTADMPRLGRNITFTCTGSPTFTPSAATTFGSLTIAAGMTCNGTLTMAGRSATTITTNGAAVGFSPLTIQAFGGSVSMLDAYGGGASGRLSITDGTFATNGFSLSLVYVNFNGSTRTRGIDLGASTVTLVGTNSSGATPWQTTGAGVTVTPGTSTIKLTDTSAVGKTFNGGGLTYYNLWFSGASSGVYGIGGSNTFNDLRVDSAGTTLQMTAGTTQTVNSFTVNGTTAVPGTDVKIARLFGLANGYFSTPHAAANSFTGDLDFRTYVAMDDWTPGATHEIVAKNDSDSSNFGFLWRLNPTGVMQFYYSMDGTTLLTLGTTLPVFPGAVDGQGLHLRMTLDVDNGAGGKTLRAYTSPDGLVWTQFGVDQIGGTAGAIFASTSAVKIGARGSTGSGGPVSGVFRYFRAYNGIDGALAFNFDPNDYVSGLTWTAGTTGETWTKNGNVIVSSTNQVAICSATAASHTLTKAGGGQVICENVSVNRSTAGPGSSFIAIASNSMDGGNNTGWVFGEYADAVGTSAGSSAVTGVADSTLGVTPLRDIEPERFRAGDTLVWTKSLSDYSAADGWVLAYRFISPTSKFDLGTSAYGSDHLVVSFVSATFDPGTYTWQAYVTRADERFTVGKGTCLVLPNLAAVTDPGYDDRSFNRKALDALNDGLEQYGANAHVHQYTIEGRTMTYRTFADFMAARDRLRKEVAREDAAQRARAGGTRKNQVRVKFT